MCAGKVRLYSNGHRNVYVNAKKGIVVLLKSGLQTQGIFKRRNSCFKSEDAEEISRDLWQ